VVDCLWDESQGLAVIRVAVIPLEHYRRQKVAYSASAVPSSELQTEKIVVVELQACMASCSGKALRVAGTWVAIGLGRLARGTRPCGLDTGILHAPWSYI